MDVNEAVNTAQLVHEFCANIHTLTELCRSYQTAYASARFRSASPIDKNRSIFDYVQGVYN